MTHPEPISYASPALAVSTRSRAIGIIPLTLIIFGLMLLSFLAQLPGHRAADYQLFTLYDPGTVLKGDYLLTKVDAAHPEGYIPTVDFGYTHGLISLLYGRAGFAILGLHAWSYLILTLALELVMAYALARFFTAVGIARSKPALLLFFISLPMAIMPAYLVLTHPLEAMLILLALAAQAEGNRARALSLMTVCIFVKPSMAYVYGLILALLILWQTRSATLTPRQRLHAIVLQIRPAIIALVFLIITLWYRFGLMPVLKTMFPFTGAKTYTATHFGLFDESGLDFWLPLRDFHPLPSVGAILQAYLGMTIPGTRADVAAPIAIFLLAALVTTLGALVCIIPALRASATSPLSPPPESRYPTRPEMLLTIGLLHTTFLLGFFGWKGSWSYYSYLPALGLTLAAFMLPLPRLGQIALFACLGALMLVGQAGFAQECLSAWGGKERTHTGPGTDPGLYYWPSREGAIGLLDEWRSALRHVGNRQTVVMTYGWLPNLPANIQMRDAWFPQPGIPTPLEIDRVKRQVAAAEYVILCNQYGDELWDGDAFADVRPQFRPSLTLPDFTVLQRISATTPTSAASATAPEPETRTAR